MRTKVKKIIGGIACATAVWQLHHDAVAGLAVTRTLVYHQLTKQPADVAVRGQPVLSDSGGRAAFAGGDPTRVFLFDADGGNLAEVDAYTNAVIVRAHAGWAGSFVLARILKTGA